MSNSANISNIKPREGIFLGLISTLAGLFIILRATNIIQAGDVYAPLWLLGVCGFIFLFLGIFAFYYAIRNWSKPDYIQKQPADFSIGPWILGVVIVTCFGIIGTWIAFGPGERKFEGGITGGEIEGRIAFGVGAVIVAIIAVWMWIWGIRQISINWKKRNEPTRISG